MKFRFVFLFIYFISNIAFGQSRNLYFTNNGKISFRSEAQQELINAESNNMRGIIDVDKRTFVFQVLIRTFEGFNSALQQEHFNEKYLESEKFPEAIFKGKIIEDVNLDNDGSYEVRAKGMLNIHGIEMERIIKSQIIVKNGALKIQSAFSVLLSEHNIKIPKVVHEKIASEILVTINAELEKR